MVPSLMGKQSWKERPPRLWPCQKAVLAGFEPRNASSRTPRDTKEGPEDSTGVTAGETALSVSAMRPDDSGREGDATGELRNGKPGRGDTAPSRLF